MRQKRSETRFDELLLRPGKNRFQGKVQWAQAAGIVLFVFGFCLFVLFTYNFYWLYFEVPSGSMRAEEFGQFNANLGQAVAGAAAVMALGGLFFLAEQVTSERESRLEQQMPLVFIAPRLQWRVTGVSNGKLDVQELSLVLGIRNVSDAPATQMEVQVREAFYEAGPGQRRAVSLPEVDSQFMDYLPGLQAQSEGNGSDEFQQRIVWPLGNECKELLDGVLSSDPTPSEYPALTLRLSASCQTVRRAALAASGAVVWSPRQCREARNSQQRGYLRGYSAAKAAFDRSEGGLDHFFKTASANPLVPFVDAEIP